MVPGLWIVTVLDWHDFQEQSYHPGMLHWKARVGTKYLWMIREGKCREAECASFFSCWQAIVTKWRGQYDLHFIEPAGEHRREKMKKRQSKNEYIYDIREAEHAELLILVGKQ
jgi:hypothetical protein